MIFSVSTTDGTSDRERSRKKNGDTIPFYEVRDGTRVETRINLVSTRSKVHLISGSPTRLWCETGRH